MRLLELFSGTRSVSKVARELGWETLSLDIDPTHGPDLLVDILDFDETQYPKDYFDLVWASPDCASYSVANNNKAKRGRTEAMQFADRLVAKTRQIIDYFECHWCIENPEGSRMWKREVARGLLESSCVTSYCCFGTLHRKSTRIANSFGLVLPRCSGVGLCSAMVGSSHKERAQQGSGGYCSRCHTTDELHSIPSELCRSVLAQVLVLVK